MKALLLLLPLLVLSQKSVVPTKEDWPDGGKPAQIDCYKVTTVSKTSGEYVSVIECVPEGGKVSFDEAHVVYIEPVVDQQTKREISIFDCACSTGSGCEMLVPAAPKFNQVGGWVPALNGITLNSTKWRGAGCQRKTCVELGGKTSWPAGCPTK